ncbi:Protein REVEILLE 6 [Dionaea muscipula]
MELPGASRIASPDITNTSSSDDPSKRARKPYTITKSRESWTEPEHDKFFEALQLFDRDWKKIEAYIGSKTAIQIRSHAQKYFLKVQKSGSNEHLPPPRPKRKAAHPYPQKAAKYDHPPALKSPSDGAALSSWSGNCAQEVGKPHVTKGNMSSTGRLAANNCSSSTESTPMAQANNETKEQLKHGPPLRVLPDFVQVYSFIGSVFDPDASNHLQRLKRMDPIDVETVLLLMRNLSINLSSPDFEDHRRLLSSYEISSDNAYSSGTAINCDG